MEWKDKALSILKSSLTPIPHELSELDWKSGLSPKTERLAQHVCAFANHSGGGMFAFGIFDDGTTFRDLKSWSKRKSQVAQAESQVVWAKSQVACERKSQVAWTETPDASLEEMKGGMFDKKGGMADEKGGMVDEKCGMVDEKGGMLDSKGSMSAMKDKGKL